MEAAAMQGWHLGISVRLFTGKDLMHGVLEFARFGPQLAIFGHRASLGLLDQAKVLVLGLGGTLQGQCQGGALWGALRRSKRALTMALLSLMSFWQFALACNTALGERKPLRCRAGAPQRDEKVGMPTRGAPRVGSDGTANET